MLLTIIAIAIGVAIGYARGGHHRNLASLRIDWWPLLLIGLALQAAAESADIPAALSASVIGLFFLLVGSIRNTTPARTPALAGFGVIATGVAANLAVTVANGHVPVRFEALVDAGLAEPDSVVAFDDLRRIEDGSTRLAVLGDVIPLPVLDNVVSFGDLITHAGLIVLIQAALLPRRTSRGLTVDELLALAVDEPIDLTEGLGPAPLLDLTEPEPRSPAGEPSDLLGDGTDTDDAIGRIRPISR